MALTGEFIGSDLTIEFLEPGSVSNYFALTTYVNEDAATHSTGDVETTAHGTTTRTFIPGLKDGGDYSFTLMYNTTPAAAQQPQHRVFQLWDNRTVTTWRVRERGTGTGLPEVTFSAYVNSFAPNLTNDDEAVSASVTLKVAGAVTRAFQS